MTQQEGKLQGEKAEAITLVGKLTGTGIRNAVLYTAQSLTEAQQAQARANIGAGTPYTLPNASTDALGGVKADAVEAEDTQPVRIGGDGKLYTAPGGSGDAVLYTAQSLTEEQQEQARANIGAGTPYTLPQASPDALGGVKADSAEATDTQPVRIGGDGKLYTAPGGDTSIGITGSSAGQIPKVKAVDASGAPTEWKAEKDTTPFIVTVGTTSSGYTSSHTFDEIVAAASAGRVVMAYTDYIHFPQVSQSLYGAYFDLISTQDTAIFVYIDPLNMIKYTFAVDPFSISASASYLSATSSTFGGVKADAAETADTQPVRIGGDGKLYTAPGGSADISLGISGATAGQMAKVKAVDASGAPTEWEAGDAAGGYSGYGNRNPDYTYTVTEVISGLYISEINGNTFSANKLACLVEFPAGTGGFYYHALYTLQGSNDKNYCISNHNAPKLSNISTKDSVVFFIVEKLNNQNYKYNYIGQCKTREQVLDGSYGTYAAAIFPNSIEGETSIKSIFLKGENAFGVGVKISIWLD